MSDSSQLTKTMSFRVPMEYYFEVKKQAVNKGFTLSDEIMERLFTYRKHVENGISIESYNALKTELESITSDFSKEISDLQRAYDGTLAAYKEKMEILEVKLKAKDVRRKAGEVSKDLK